MYVRVKHSLIRTRESRAEGLHFSAFHLECSSGNHGHGTPVLNAVHSHWTAECWTYQSNCQLPVLLGGLWLAIYILGGVVNKPRMRH